MGGLTFMFETLGAQDITDYCESANDASSRVMEKVGMRLVAQWSEAAEPGATVDYLRHAIKKAEWMKRQQTC